MGTMLIIGMGPKKGPKHMNPMEKFLSKGADKEPLMEDEMSSESNGKISFSLPPGFKVPDGVKDGEPFDAMATLMVKDGKLVLGELDGTPVGDEETEESVEAEPSEAPEPAEEPEADDYESSESSEPAEEPESEDESEDEGDSKLGFLDAIEKKAAKRKK